MTTEQPSPLCRCKACTARREGFAEELAVLREIADIARDLAEVAGQVHRAGVSGVDASMERRLRHEVADAEKEIADVLRRSLIAERTGPHASLAKVLQFPRGGAAGLRKGPRDLH
jgi:hypothetical protein